MDYTKILLRPVVTEKATMLRESAGQVAFFVDPRANKIEIGKAVETLFPGTKVAAVNTMHCRGKLKRMGRNAGYTPAWKKAIVTLTADSKGIEFFESMQ